jgi:hypothetical protein
MGIVAELGDSKQEKRLNCIVLGFLKKMASFMEHLDQSDELD